MSNTLDYIHRMLSSIIEIDDNEWEYFSKKLEVKEFKKKELLLHADGICRDVYFVNSGLIRIFFTDKNGRESTFHFAQEYDLATDYESFLQHTPSKYYIQALEDTQVVIISHNLVLDGYKKLRNGEKLGRLLTEKYFILYCNKIQALYTLTPIERYRAMNKIFPFILQRVPQHYIASFLNITSVHLSRLKNELD
jgi:CRP-like cAMP-binding protein